MRSKVAVGCADNTVRILEPRHRQGIHKIGNHENWVLGTVFGKDSKTNRLGGPRSRGEAHRRGFRSISRKREPAARRTHGRRAASFAKDIVVIGGEDRIPYVYLMDRPKNMKIADDTTLIHQARAAAGRYLRACMVARRQRRSPLPALHPR